MERIAFIDLGSNSVRFVIYEISDTGSYRLIYQEKNSIRLSENMWGRTCYESCFSVATVLCTYGKSA